MVLIDTWWNVNKTYAKIFDELKGFNRYMVECESYRSCTYLS